MASCSAPVRLIRRTFWAGIADRVQHGANLGRRRIRREAGRRVLTGDFEGPLPCMRIGTILHAAVIFALATLLFCFVSIKSLRRDESSVFLVVPDGLVHQALSQSFHCRTVGTVAAVLVLPTVWPPIGLSGHIPSFWLDREPIAACRVAVDYPLAPQFRVSSRKRSAMAATPRRSLQRVRKRQCY